ncbi:MAG: winged helix DNA-binding domain-containing protein [Acidimicrobiales bacterium]
MITVGPDQLNRATLQRQMLLRREPVTVNEAVRRIAALQAQSPSAPYVALWNRIADLDFDAVDQAFADRSLVKASLMRITLHAVDANDYPAFHTASTPLLRAARLNDRRYRDSGLTTEDADRGVPALLDFLETPRSKSEILDHLARSVSSEPRLWWALRTYAPLVHAPTGPPWSFDRDTRYERAPTVDRPPVDEAVRSLVRHYLSAFGPATYGDFAQFSLQVMSVARPAFESLRGELVSYSTVDGDELFDVADAPELPDPDTPAPPRLMAMWDSTLLAYRDRSRIIPDHYRPYVIRRNGDVLPTVLVNGRVAGVWKGGPDGIEVGAFEPFDLDTWDALDIEARHLHAVLADRARNVFERAGTWWPKLPKTSTRLLGTQ